MSRWLGPAIVTILFVLAAPLSATAQNGDALFIDKDGTVRINTLIVDNTIKIGPPGREWTLNVVPMNSRLHPTTNHVLHIATNRGGSYYLWETEPSILYQYKKSRDAKWWIMSDGSTSDVSSPDSSGRRSDSRLKTGVAPLTDVGPQIDALNPVTYRWSMPAVRHGDDDAQIGFLADEVQDLFPELVESGEDGYLRLRYAEMTAVLAQGLKETRAELAATRSQLVKRDAIIAKTLARLDTMEARLKDMSR